MSPFAKTWRAARFQAERAERKTPGWVGEADRAFAGLQPLTNAGLLTPILPLAEAARADVRARVAASPFAPQTAAALEGLDRALEESLIDRLQHASIKTLVRELGVAAERGLLAGDTPSARYVFFCECLQDRAFVASLLAQYPALTRRLLTLINNWRDAMNEMLTRLAEDLSDIRANLFATPNEGALVHAAMLGDSHAGGRGVHRLHFESGQRLIYKPRPPAMEAAMHDFLVWANGRGLSPDLWAPPAIDRKTYGWVRHVDSAPCADAAAVQRYFRRQGVNLALTYVLGATDLHFENIIAAGEYPVIVDWETLFQARPPHSAIGATAAAVELLEDSGQRTLMLPMRIYGEPNTEKGYRSADLSALGAAEEQEAPFSSPTWDNAGTDDMRLVHRFGMMSLGDALPKLGEKRAPARAHLEEIERGFAEGYEFLRRQGRPLCAANGPLAAFKGRTVRHLYRPTSQYFRLLQESWHPDHARDMAGLEQHIRDRLRGLDGDFMKGRVVHDAETADLLAGDIPYFQAIVGGRRARSPLRPEPSAPLSSIGWRSSLARIDGLGEADLRRQMWVTRLAFADLNGRNTPRKPQKFHARELLSLAGRICERLCDEAVVRGDRATWLFPMVENGERLAPAAVGFDLYHGLAGIALFLGRMSLIAERKRERRFAFAALNEALAMERRTAGANLGAFDGVAGLAYAAALLGKWFDVPVWRRRAAAMIRTNASLAATCGKDDLISGAAGFVTAGIAVASIVGDDTLLGTLRPVVNALHARAGEALPNAADAGLAHGKAGLGFSLIRWANVSGERAMRAHGVKLIKQDIKAAAGARKRGDSEAGLAWCRGDLGATWALLHLGEAAPATERLVQELEQTAFETEPALCLCHGALGVVEFLQAAAHADVRGAARLLRRARTAAFGRLFAGELCSDHAHNVESPGLLLGLAGSGYTLLRGLDRRSTPLILMLDAH